MGIQEDSQSEEKCHLFGVWHDVRLHVWVSKAVGVHGKQVCSFADLGRDRQTCLDGNPKSRGVRHSGGGCGVQELHHAGGAHVGDKQGNGCS